MAAPASMAPFVRLRVVHVQNSHTHEHVKIYFEVFHVSTRSLFCFLLEGCIGLCQEFGRPRFSANNNGR